MKQALLIICCSVLSGHLFSQTKLIAHKSHSGTSETFSISLTEALFSDPGSNFGAYPERFITTAKLDSLIFLSDTTSVMVTSRVSTNTWNDSVTVWRPGRDTVVNHPAFSRVRGVDKIRSSIQEDFHFRNSAGSVIFINGDTIRKPKYINYEEPGRRNDLPLLVKPENNRKPPFDNGIMICVVIAAMVSLLTGISVFYFSRIKREFIN